MTENRGKWHDGHAEVLMNYLTRYIEKDIESALETSGVVVVAGPKFCGKIPAVPHRQAWKTFITREQAGS